jgi:hypothetical protein
MLLKRDLLMDFVALCDLLMPIPLLPRGFTGGGGGYTPYHTVLAPRPYPKNIRYRTAW